MSIRRTTKKAFTLVEILIVVIILGILAAIVIPQFTNASQDARRSSLASQLQTLRSQIELYKLQHLDVLPDLATTGKGWSQFINKTDKDGVVDAAGTFGPYMQSAPINPVNGLSVVVVGAPDATTGLPTPDASAGFIYDYGTAAAPGTGKIWGMDKLPDGTTPIFAE